MRAATLGLIAAMLLAAAPVRAQPSSMPFVQGTAQVAAGVAGAWLVGMAAWSAIDDPMAPDRKVKGDAGYQPNANTAYAIGSWVGSTLAVYAVGKAFDGHTGSLGGTAIGTGIVSVFLLLGREEPYLPLIGLAIGAPLQALAGVVGHGR